MNGDIAAATPDADIPNAPQVTNHYSIDLIEQYLSALIPKVQADPDYLLSLPQFPRIALESPSSTGGKFWLGAPLETGVSIRWGKLGAQGTVRHIPTRSCLRQNPVLELKKRILQKLHNGYDIIPHETALP